MYYVKEGISLDVMDKDGNEHFDKLKLIKEFDNVRDAHNYVSDLISMKPQTSYVRGIMGKRFVGFDYGSWSHFYFIVSDDNLDYAEIYKD